MPTCKNCGKEFPNKIEKNGNIISLSGRKFCLECSPIGGKNTRSYIINLQENEAFCARCQQTKQRKEFYSRKDSGKPLSYCISCQKEIKDLKLQENIERIAFTRDGYCQDCNLTYPAPIYEFYSDMGIYNLSKARNMSFEKLLNELKSYLMLCRNCSALRDWVKG